MMKEEFEKLVGHSVTEKDYELIQFVYTWHPSISETEGKKQIAELYKTGGILVIDAMKEAAQHSMRLDNELRELERKTNAVKERIANVKEGYLSFERCFEEVRKYYDATEEYPEYMRFRKEFVEPNYSIKDIREAEKILGIVH